MFGHSLLHPTMTDSDLKLGLELSKKYGIATACIKSYATPLVLEVRKDSGVGVRAVIGFPHGNSATEIQVLEAKHAVTSDATEIDVVVNVGKVLGGDWDYVSDEIQQVNDDVIKYSSALKVIFKNDYFSGEEIVGLYGICSRVQVAFIKTSTGYGFVKQPNGTYSYKGATVPHLKLMLVHHNPKVQVKAARALDDLLKVMALGVTRVGATATASILEDALSRGFGEVPKEVKFDAIESWGGGY
jgi:deoxyribose-phosphate aldolase